MFLILSKMLRSLSETTTEATIRFEKQQKKCFLFHNDTILQKNIP